jgi:hypothetical protein
MQLKAGAGCRPLALWLAVSLALLWTIPAHPRPLDNSPEAISLHGVVNDGRTANRLNIRGVQLVFPPELAVKPLTQYPQPIKKGEAQQATVHLLFPSFRSPPPNEAHRYNEYLNGVRLEFRADLQENAKKNVEWIKSETWEKVTEHGDLGLRAYEKSGTAWGAITYVVDTGRARTPMGGPIVFRCTATSGTARAPSRCMAGYMHPSGLFIRYVFAGRLIDEWRVIDTSVRRIADRVVKGAD